ncbi:Mitochondrial outer membrane protein porin [Nymphaea thermarum]|nr:Mitochondrial outer membrane protein porin [Nymphaea thermarum]
MEKTTRDDCIEVKGDTNTTRPGDGQRWPSRDFIQQVYTILFLQLLVNLLVCSIVVTVINSFTDFLAPVTPGRAADNIKQVRHYLVMVAFDGDCTNDKGDTLVASFFHSVSPLTSTAVGDTLVASFFHSVSPLTSTAVGAELSHNFSKNESTLLTIGTQHAWDPLTLVTAQLNNSGKASALIQHQWRPKLFFTISGEMDTRATEKSAIFGQRTYHMKSKRNSAHKLPVVVAFDGDCTNDKGDTLVASFFHSVSPLTSTAVGDTLVASFFHSVSPLTSTAVGAELSHSFSKNESTLLTIGTQHAWDPLTLVKAQLNNYGKANALIQHQWRPKLFFTISGEMDTRATEKSAIFGQHTYHM